MLLLFFLIVSFTSAIMTLKFPVHFLKLGALPIGNSFFALECSCGYGGYAHVGRKSRWISFHFLPLYFGVIRVFCVVFLEQKCCNRKFTEMSHSTELSRRAHDALKLQILLTFITSWSNCTSIMLMTRVYSPYELSLRKDIVHATDCAKNLFVFRMKKRCV